MHVREYSFSLCEASAEYLDLADKLRELARACAFSTATSLAAVGYLSTAVVIADLR